MSDGRVEIPGSTLKQASGEKQTAADPNQPLTVTLVLRRPAGAEDLGPKLLSGQLQSASQEALSADPGDLQKVIDFAGQNGLAVTDQSLEKRTVHVSGTVDQMQRAFGVDLQMQQAEPHNLSYPGAISIPAALSGIVTAVLGLDQRPVARHHGVPG